MALFRRNRTGNNGDKDTHANSATQRIIMRETATHTNLAPQQMLRRLESPKLNAASFEACLRKLLRRRSRGRRLVLLDNASHQQNLSFAAEELANLWNFHSPHSSANLRTSRFDSRFLLRSAFFW